jgi:tRNA(Ile)-lysidine synthase
MLEKVKELIRTHAMAGDGAMVLVGLSGGADSMALLHFMHSVAKPMEIEIVAVNVNHNLRAGSRKDSQFVRQFCKDNGIAFVGYNVDVAPFAKLQKMGIEQAARIKRYECFEQAIKKFKLGKFAMAHHSSDQAETILMHIFRGSGIAGARGMDAMRGIYVRPFLETAKSDIVAYNYRNQVPHVVDESNADNSFARNFIRNQVIPLVQCEWRNVEKNIVDFGRNCRCDDEYLNSIVNRSSLIADMNNVRVPLNYFVYPEAVISRIIMSAFDMIGAKENIEKKHIDLIMTLARTGENGSRTDLPNNLFAVREYEYLAIVKKTPAVREKIYSFKIGRTSFAEYGTIIVTKTISHKDALERGLMVIDVDKLPRNAKWRTRADGDIFTKFGGGTKPLNSYLIDKKIPARMRDKIPVLASGNEIFAIAGVEISERVRTDRETLEAYVLEFVKD